MAGSYKKSPIKVPAPRGKTLGAAPRVGGFPKGKSTSPGLRPLSTRVYPKMPKNGKADDEFNVGFGVGLNMSPSIFGMGKRTK